MADILRSGYLTPSTKNRNKGESLMGMRCFFRMCMCRVMTSQRIYGICFLRVCVSSGGVVR
jgi:hypothetical protein